MYTSIWYAYKSIFVGGLIVRPDRVVVTLVLPWLTLASGGGMGSGGGGWLGNRLSNLLYIGVSSCMFQLW